MRALFASAALTAVTAALYACSSGGVTTVFVAADGGPDAAPTDAGPLTGELPTNGAGRTAADTTALCNYLVSCSAITLAQLGECKASYAGILFTSDCLAQLNTAIGAKDCTGIAPGGPVTEVCFPQCDGSDAVCNSDGTFSQCRNGSVAIVSCQASCAANGQTYTGTCGNSFETKISPAEQCWCAGGDAGT